MQIFNYTKSLNLKELSKYIIYSLFLDSILLLISFMDKSIGIHLWIISFSISILSILFIIINKRIKSRVLYIFSGFFSTSIKFLLFFGVLFVVKAIGFSWNWFIFILFFYFLSWIIPFLPDKISYNIKMILNNKGFIMILFLLLILIASFNTSKIALRNMEPGSFEQISVFIRVGLAILVFGYYILFLVASAMKDSIKMFES